MPKVIVVTGCDSAHYDLVSDLLTSLGEAGREGLAVGFVHVGDGVVPAQIAAAVDDVAHVADSGFSANPPRGFRLACLAIKPRLPEFFPGYETYVWLDGDTWVQNRSGLDQIVESARFLDLCAHPELDPSYYRMTIPSERLLSLYRGLYGPDDAVRHVALPMFNAGVFAARADSPLWPLWREALAEVHDLIARSPQLYYSDQVPLHRLIAGGRLSVHPLRAINNWMVHAAQPGLNLKSKRLVAPTYPYEEINIVHLTGATKDMTFSLDNTDRHTSYRYGAIKAVLAG
ncbi:MAG TPA: hypothetical protein VHZ26_18375 [Caulobacteraceae bacterium]|nr:hypothetical protein [Caulobacteraceae bacterium]